MSSISRVSVAGHRTPDQMRALFAWWDWRDSSRLAVNVDGTGGSPADTEDFYYLADRSGLGNHLFHLSARDPMAWSSSGYGESTGSSPSDMETGAITSSSDMHSVSMNVYRRNEGAGDRYLIGGQGSANVRDVGFHIDGVSAGEFAVDGGSGAVNTSGTPGMTAETWMTMSFVFLSSSQCVIRRNGALLEVVNPTDMDDLDGITIFNNQASALSTTFFGRISEAVVLKATTLSLAEVMAAEVYLATTLPS